MKTNQDPNQNMPNLTNKPPSTERRQGQPLRERVRLQLGRGVLHDGLDPHLLGRRHAVGGVRGRSVRWAR